MPYHLKDDMSLTLGILAALLLSAVASALIIDLGCRRRLCDIATQLMDACTVASIDAVFRELQSFIDNDCVFPWNVKDATMLKASARSKRRRILGLE